MTRNHAKTRRNSTRSITHAYDLALALKYYTTTGGHGEGETIRIDREHVLMRCGEQLQSGELIQIDIAWPVLAGGQDRLILRVHGIVTAGELDRCEVSIGVREFINLNRVEAKAELYAY